LSSSVLFRPGVRPPPSSILCPPFCNSRSILRTLTSPRSQDSLSSTVLRILLRPPFPSPFPSPLPLFFLCWLPCWYCFLFPSLKFSLSRGPSPSLSLSLSGSHSPSLASRASPFLLLAFIFLSLPPPSLSPCPSPFPFLAFPAGSAIPLPLHHPLAPSCPSDPWHLSGAFRLIQNLQLKTYKKINDFLHRHPSPTFFSVKPTVDLVGQKGPTYSPRKGSRGMYQGSSTSPGRIYQEVACTTESHNSYMTSNSSFALSKCATGSTKTSGSFRIQRGVSRAIALLSGKRTSLGQSPNKLNGYQDN